MTSNRGSINRVFSVGAHDVRLVTTTEDYGSSTYRPGLRLYLSGPNGSIAGTGPKGWPLHNRIRRFRSRHAWAKTGWHKRNNGHYGWTDALYIPLPHITWAWGYRWRKVGGLQAYQLVYRLYQKVL